MVADAAYARSFIPHPAMGSRVLNIIVFTARKTTISVKMLILKLMLRSVGESFLSLDSS